MLAVYVRQTGVVYTEDRRSWNTTDHWPSFTPTNAFSYNEIAAVRLARYTTDYTEWLFFTEAVSVVVKAVQDNDLARNRCETRRLRREIFRRRNEEFHDRICTEDVLRLNARVRKTTCGKNSETAAYWTSTKSRKVIALIAILKSCTLTDTVALLQLINGTCLRRLNNGDCLTTVLVIEWSHRPIYRATRSTRPSFPNPLQKFCFTSF